MQNLMQNLGSPPPPSYKLSGECHARDAVCGASHGRELTPGGGRERGTSAVSIWDNMNSDRVGWGGGLGSWGEREREPMDKPMATFTVYTRKV